MEATPRASAEDAKRAIKIKTGSLRRLFRERAMYAEEVELGERETRAMRARGADASDVKQQVRRRSKTRAMVVSSVREGVGMTDDGMADRGRRKTCCRSRR